MAEAKVGAALRKFCSGPGCGDRARSVFSSGKFQGAPLNPAQKKFLRKVSQSNPPKK